MLTFASRALLVLTAVALAGCVAPSGSPTQLSGVAGPQGPVDQVTRRQLWLIPSPALGVLMHAYLFRPDGDGPFRLAVINHGSDQEPFHRARMPMPPSRR